MTFCFDCFYRPCDASNERCVKCMQRHGYVLKDGHWQLERYNEPDCKECVHFVKGDFYHSKCPDDCVESTIMGVIKHKFAAKAATSPAKASEPKSNDITLPNTNSLSDRVKRHAEICAGLTDLYERKNHDYGDSFHKTFVEEGFAMARIRLSDKLERFKSLSKGTGQRVNDESIVDTLKDMANYAIMTIIEIERGKL